MFPVDLLMLFQHGVARRVAVHIDFFADDFGASGLTVLSHRMECRAEGSSRSAHLGMASELHAIPVSVSLDGGARAWACAKGCGAGSSFWDCLRCRPVAVTCLHLPALVRFTPFAALAASVACAAFSGVASFVAFAGLQMTSLNAVWCQRAGMTKHSHS